MGSAAMGNSAVSAAQREHAFGKPRRYLEKARNASAWMIRNEDRVIVLNDRGELILAKFTPSGYAEIGRTKVIKPTSPPGARRELGAVIWSHPAFANRHMIVRNDEEVIRVSLDERDYR